MDSTDCFSLTARMDGHLVMTITARLMGEQTGHNSPFLVQPTL